MKARIRAWLSAHGVKLRAGALFGAWIAVLLTSLLWLEDVAWGFVGAATVCVVGLIAKSRVRFMTGRLAAVTAALSGSLLSITIAFQVDRGKPLESDPATYPLMLALFLAGMVGIFEQWLEHGDAGKEQDKVRADVRELHELNERIGADLGTLQAEVQRLQELLAAASRAPVGPARSQSPGVRRRRWRR